MKTEQNNESTMKFLKEAFCIDGDIRCLGTSTLVLHKHKSVKNECLSYELTDSKRGIFIITLTK